MPKAKCKGTQKLEFRLQARNGVTWSCWRTVSRGPRGNMRFNTYNLNPRVGTPKEIAKAKQEIQDACNAQDAVVQFRTSDADHTPSTLLWLEKKGEAPKSRLIHA